MTTPEQRARIEIDRLLTAAGWVVQNIKDANRDAARGVALREFPLNPGHGDADYLLYVDGKAAGVVEAKKHGATLKGVEPQSARYAQGLPASLPAWARPLPFLYESTGAETQFTNGLDPEPRSRATFAFHRPEMLAEWCSALPGATATQTGTSPHRSIYNLWRQVLEYFDAYLIGLTATPNKQTFGFFNQNLVMEYGHQQAVADGVNVNYDVYRIKTEVTEAGSRVEAGYWVQVLDTPTDARSRTLAPTQFADDFENAPEELAFGVPKPAKTRTFALTLRNRRQTASSGVIATTPQSDLQ